MKRRTISSLFTLFLVSLIVLATVLTGCGPQGPPGPQGPEGPQGPQGPQGPPGPGDGHSLDAADGDPVDTVYVDNDGNVGIGTTSPARILDVDGTMEATIYYDSNNISYYANPSGTSYLKQVRANIYFDWNLPYWVDPASTSYLKYLSAEEVTADKYYDRNDTSYYVNPASISYVHDVRANYFTDRNDYHYYVDPNGYTRLLNLNVTGIKSFIIDHPLDPENKYLYHFSVESPDLKNIYDGVVVLDNQGEAWVELPVWFEALNRDFRYQLTAIGMPAPNLYIAEEISDNYFKIAGGEPGMKISWQVTGIRHDAYAKANPILVEEEKPSEEQGKYLHPEAFGLDESMGIGYMDSERLD